MRSLLARLHRSLKVSQVKCRWQISDSSTVQHQRTFGSGDRKSTVKTPFGSPPSLSIASCHPIRIDCISSSIRSVDSGSLLLYASCTSSMRPWARLVRVATFRTALLACARVKIRYGYIGTGSRDHSEFKSCRKHAKNTKGQQRAYATTLQG